MGTNYRAKYKKHYGIDFSSDYVVHHIDFNRENNDIDNLLLLPKDLHSKYHGLLNDFKSNHQDRSSEKYSILLNMSISPTDIIEYSTFGLSGLLQTLMRCAQWADYKAYLDGKMPNIHNISL